MPPLHKKTWILKQTDDVQIIFYPWGLHKFILPFFGLLYLGWIGIPVAFIIGCLLDVKYYERAVPPPPADLGMTFMMLAMGVMKANGAIDSQTVSYAHAYIAQQYGEAYLHQRRHIFDGFRHQKIPVDGLCEQVDAHLDYAAKMQLMYFLFGIAYADGQLTRAELTFIAGIADNIQVTADDFTSLMAMHKSVSESAYEILEIASDVTDEEVKKAYYRLAKKHHPDKVAHLGEEYQLSAKEKFQRIQEAYDSICQARGIP